MSQAAAVPMTFEPCTAATPRFRVIEGGLATRAPKTGGKVTNLACMALVIAFMVALCAMWAAQDIRAARRIDRLAQSDQAITVTVCSGDSVWQIAEEHPIEGYSTRELVECIRLSNQLTNCALAPGMRLQIPQL